MSYQFLQLEQANQVATVWINRAELHNAFNTAVIEELQHCFSYLNVQDDVRVVVLAGRGKSFSAGADLNWMKQAGQASQQDNEADALKLAKMLQFFDAVGLGAFTAIGAEVAVRTGLYQWFVVVTLAVLTGTGGGLIRDVFAREIPYVFRKEVYAMASILGAILYIIVFRLAGSQMALYSCFLATTLIRLYCMEKDVHLLKVGKVNIQ